MAQRNSVTENIGTDGNSVLLPREVSSEIWQDAFEASAVMRFANRITLPAVGLAVPMITGSPEAQWVDESDEIAVGDSTLDSREMKGHKIGVIETFSKEFRRDLPAIYAELRRRLPQTLAQKFDFTVANGGGPVNETTFDSFLKTGVQTLPLTSATAYDDLVDIDTAVADQDGELSAYAMAPRARSILLKAKDPDGRPLLVNDIQNGGGVRSLLGVDYVQTKGFYTPADTDSDEVLGIAGDWRSAFYGVVEDIEVSVSDQATVNKGGTTLNLWQRDMFALKVTAHLGFMIRKGHEGRFVRVTGAAATGV